MKSIECEFESETLAAALQSRWPAHVDAALRAHVASCAVCFDVAAIAGAIGNARDETRACALLPNPGLVWWRAHLRARREAVEAAGRPITAAQIVALACATGLLGAFFGATSTWFQSVIGRTVSTAAHFNLAALLASTPAFITEHQALIFVIGAVVLLLPTTVYLVVLRD